MDRLELAARSLIAMVRAGGEPDLTDLEAALEPDPTPMSVFGEQDPTWVIPAGQEGAQGLRVTFGEHAVGLGPIGFPGGFSLSYPAACNLRDLLIEKLGAAGVYTTVRVVGECMPRCFVCYCPFEPEEEGQTECDPTGCPARYGDIEPIEQSEERS